MSEAWRMSWCVYLVRCSDASLYCGISTDVRRRVAEHNRGYGSRYVLARRPVRLVWTRLLSSQSAALKLEAVIKKMPKADKERMVRERLLWPYAEEGPPVGHTINRVAAEELRQDLFPQPCPLVGVRDE